MKEKEVNTKELKKKDKKSFFILLEIILVLFSKHLNITFSPLKFSLKFTSALL